MSEQSTESLYQKQKETRPKIEDILFEYLKGDVQKNALDFIAYLKSIKMTPQWGSGNSWKLSYKSKAIGYIKLRDGSWFICPSGNHCWGYDDFICNEDFKDLILKNIKPCTNCGACAPGTSITAYGKEFNHICGWFTIRFCDPDSSDLDLIKQLIEIRKSYIIYRFYKKLDS